MVFCTYKHHTRRMKKNRKLIFLCVMIVLLALLLYDYCNIRNDEESVIESLDQMLIYSYEDFEEIQQLLECKNQIEYISKDKHLLIEEKKIIRDEVEAISANLHVNIKGNVFKRVVKCQVIIAPIYEISPYIMNSLKHLIDFSYASINENKDANTNYIQDFKDALEKGENLINNNDIYLLEATCREIIEKGRRYFTPEDDDEVKDVYRNILLGLIWSAKAELLIEPELYTKAAKGALQREINQAETVLAGEYTTPYSNSRSFINIEQQNAAEFAIRHYTAIDDFMMSDGGVEPVLEWYKKQKMSYQIQIEQIIYPDSYVDEFDEKKKKKIDAFTSGRIPDSQKITLNFIMPHNNINVYTHALLTVTNSKNNSERMLLEQGWNQSFALLGKDKMTEVDVSNIVRNCDNIQNGKLKITLDVERETQDTISIYGNGKNVKKDYVPQITLYYGEVDAKKADELYGRVEEMLDYTINRWEDADGLFELDNLKVQQEKLKNVYDKGERGYQLCSQIVMAYDCAAEFEEKMLEEAASKTSMFICDIYLEENIKKQGSQYAESLEEIKNISDEYSSSELQTIYKLLQEDDMKTLGNTHSLWSSAKNINFEVPEEAEKAYMTIGLPSEENEEEGMGHIWLDDIKIILSTSSQEIVFNSNFESDILDWKLLNNAGMISKIVNDHSYSGAGSLYIQNNVPSSKGYLKSVEFPIQKGEYSLEFFAQIHKTLKKGIQFRLHFLDASDNEIGRSDSYFYKRKSELIMRYPYEAGYQACAIMYTLTGEKEYALRAREYMMLFLDDNLQGMDAIRITNRRPEGEDKYVTVREARNANTLATAFSLIKDSEVISREWELFDDFKERLNYFAYIITDSRDRTEAGRERNINNSSNWQLDMAIGSAMLGMAFGEYIDNSGRLIRNGIFVTESQLEHVVNDSGTWPESPRYYAVVLERLSLFGKVLKQVYNINWFDTDKLINIINMYETFCQMQTPQLFMNNTISTPVVGDHIQTDGAEFALLGMYWSEVYDKEPETAQIMFDTWVKAGKKVPSGYNESEGTNMLQSFFTMFDFNEKKINSKYKLKSGDFLEDYGLYILRGEQEQEDTMVTFIANEQPIGHNHYDQLSFTIYYKSTPLVLDPGVESYFSNSKRTYISTGSHATVQFFNGKNWINSDVRSTDRNYFEKGSLRILTGITKAGDYGSQRRVLVDFKKNNMLLVYDGIETEYTSRWNLPVLSIDTPQIEGNIVRINGYQNVKFRVTFMEETEPIFVNSIMGTGNLPVRIGNKTPVVEIIRAESKKLSTGYLVMINYGDDNFEYQCIESINGIKVYKLFVGLDIYRLTINETNRKIEIEEWS